MRLELLPEGATPSVTDVQDVYVVAIHPEQDPVDMRDVAIKQLSHFEGKYRVPGPMDTAPETQLGTRTHPQASRTNVWLRLPHPGKQPVLYDRSIVIGCRGDFNAEYHACTGDRRETRPRAG